MDDRSKHHVITGGPSSAELETERAGEAYRAQVGQGLAFKGQRMGRVKSLTLSRLAIQETEGGYVLDSKKWSKFLLTGRPLAILVVGIYFLLFVVGNLQFQLLSPFATVDEQLAYYTVARNFQRYGFLGSLFFARFLHEF